MDPENDFLCGLIELGYGQDVVPTLTKIASYVPWARGWPADNVAFWNAEAFMWARKISKETRDLIEEKLACLKGRNLDIGCGAYSYVKGSVGVDFSSKMLAFNDRCSQKVEWDLAHPLPFAPGSFASVTCCFVLNYVKDFEFVLKEVHRVLEDQGDLVVVVAKELNSWQKQKEINPYPWNFPLFEVRVEEEEKVIFLWCKKKSLLN